MFKNIFKFNIIEGYNFQEKHSTKTILKEVSKFDIQNISYTENSVFFKGYYSRTKSFFIMIDWCEIKIDKQKLTYEISYPGITIWLIPMLFVSIMTGVIEKNHWISFIGSLLSIIAFLWLIKAIKSSHESMAHKLFKLISKKK